MLDSKSQIAIEKMNNLGKAKIPYLFIIDFESISPLVIPLSEINDSILFKVGDRQNISSKPNRIENFFFEKFPIDYKAYLRAFNKVMENIISGNTYLLNLTFPTRINISLTLKEMFYQSRAKYKLYYENKFVVFSPETFVKIIGNKIYSFPMKGTIDASISFAEEKLLNDEKEISEHNTIVDLIRNDLSIVAKNVRVEKLRYIEKLKSNQKNLLQTSSIISGELDKNYNEQLGTIIYNLLPAGSITGAPKMKTVEIIKEVENCPRNYFTGIFGVFDGENIDSAVMIRFVENVNDELYFRSGGGITFMSKPELEYQELLEKVYVPLI